MAKRITQLTALTTPDDADVIAIVDTSTGITKKMSRADFNQGISPSGITVAFAGASPPSGWLLCNGQAVSRSTYANLYAAIGTGYGAGDGSTTFNVPNLKGAVPVGYDAGQTEFNALNKSGGEKAHTLSSGEMPTHSHTVNDPGHAHAVYDPGHSHRIAAFGTSGSYGLVDSAHASSSGTDVRTSGDGTGIGIYGNGTGISIANSGSGQAHNNLPPYLVLNFIIKT